MSNKLRVAVADRFGAFVTLRGRVEASQNASDRL